MKRILSTALITLCTNAVASPPPANITDFDIEGFKLGMSEEEVTNMLKEKCQNGKFNAKEDKDRHYNTLIQKKFSCHLKEAEEEIEIYLALANKTYRIVSARQIEYPDNLSDADKKSMRESIYEKLVKKYGNPTLEHPQGKIAREIDYIGSPGIGLKGWELAACWGDCITENLDHYSYNVLAGDNLYAASGIVKITNILSGSDMGAGIVRVLVDVPEIKSADETFTKAVESVKNQEAEDAKKQSQQTVENIKF